MSQTTGSAVAVKNELAFDSIVDYELILQSFNLQYKMAGYYWQIGDITKTEGWVIHLSAILSQIQKLLETIIPTVIQEQVSFKIVRDLPTAEDLLNGHFGVSQIGKIISIYPDNDAIAITLSKKLIDLTVSYKGPFIPTDVCLGNIVYTCYESFKPILELTENEAAEEYIFDDDNKLIKNGSSIPFRLPDKIVWPFKDITDPIVPSPPKLLNHLYKPVALLKADPRGNVFKGLYVKNLFRIKYCVIKQGFSNMISDMAGRDIQDRLVWQNDLYSELSDIVPMPTIYGLFQEKGSTVLVMKFIKGCSLLDKLAEDNPVSKSWQTLSIPDALRFLQYTIEIAKIIAQMHSRGFVHRDIVPVNFLITRNNKVTLIDIELAYSLRHNRPNPPFALGTFGFMSPQQLANHCPTVKEDIYGLGATLLYTFTGIYPIKFNTENTEELSKSLNFLIGDKEISDTISYSLQHNQSLRPTISKILETLLKYKAELNADSNCGKRIYHGQSLANQKLLETITSALKGLAHSPIIIMNELWYSKQITAENFTSNKTRQFAISSGMSEGLAGILYVLARIHKKGIDIGPCKKAFYKGWEYLENKYFSELPATSPAPHKNAAGLSPALAEGIRSGLIDDTAANREKINLLISLPCEKLEFLNGLAAQGLCHLLCNDFISEGISSARLASIVDNLLSLQKKDGSWPQRCTSKKRNENKIGCIENDDTGVIWFLLKYISLYPDARVQKAVTHALDQMSNNRTLLKNVYSLVASKESYENGNGYKGEILLFTKAYEVLKESRYRKIAEIALSKYPNQFTHNNFSQKNGLAGIGELFLEGWRTFKNEEWKHRADWIANIFIHTIFRTKDGSGHWVMEQNNPPTADLLIGNSGIIHFLVRCLDPHTLSYRLLD